MINHNYYFPRNRIIISLFAFFSKARALPSPTLRVEIREVEKGEQDYVSKLITYEVE